MGVYLSLTSIKIIHIYSLLSEQSRLVSGRMLFFQNEIATESESISITEQTHLGKLGDPGKSIMNQAFV